jgi:hypothetical protein
MLKNGVERERVRKLVMAPNVMDCACLRETCGPFTAESVRMDEIQCLAARPSH